MSLSGPVTIPDFILMFVGTPLYYISDNVGKRSYKRLIRKVSKKLFDYKYVRKDLRTPVLSSHSVPGADLDKDYIFTTDANTFYYVEADNQDMKVLPFSFNSQQSIDLYICSGTADEDAYLERIVLVEAPNECVNIRLKVATSVGVSVVHSENLSEDECAQFIASFIYGRQSTRDCLAFILEIGKCFKWCC